MPKWRGFVDVRPEPPKGGTTKRTVGLRCRGAKGKEIMRLPKGAPLKCGGPKIQYGIVSLLHMPQ